jgi:hypothetical protein
MGFYNIDDLEQSVSEKPTSAISMLLLSRIYCALIYEEKGWNASLDELLKGIGKDRENVKKEDFFDSCKEALDCADRAIKALEKAKEVPQDMYAYGLSEAGTCYRHAAYEDHDVIFRYNKATAYFTAAKDLSCEGDGIYEYCVTLLKNIPKEIALHKGG